MLPATNDVQASGNLGPTVLNTFLDESSFNTTVLSREGSSSTFPSGVKVIRTNQDSPDALKNAFKGQDVVISLVGGSVLGDQNKYIDAAIAAGVKRFVPSDFGSDTTDSRNRELVPISDAKFVTAKYLKSKESEISWTAMITGPFFDWCTKIGFNGFNVADKTATIFDSGKACFSTTNLHTIAVALIKVLEKPEESKNQHVYISGFDTTQNELLALAEKITGTKWTVNQVSTKEHLEAGRAKVEKGDYIGILDLLQVATFSDDQIGHFDPAKLWNAKLELPQDDLEKSFRAGLEGKLAHEL
jgi:hypothetical protein